MGVLLKETAGTTLILTLNRPEVRNAVNNELANRLGEALEAADRDPSCSSVLLTATGSVFCAGSDLKARARGENVLPDKREWGFAGFVEHPISKPVIAAVTGDCLGGGFEIMLACDMAVVADHVRFGLPEVGRGRIAGAGGLIRLPQLIPPRIASEVAMAGRILDANEALALGLANAVTPAADVVPSALSLCEKIATAAPLAVESTKKILRAALVNGESKAWAMNAQEMAFIAGTADAAEGAESFVQRRAPHWTRS